MAKPKRKQRTIVPIILAVLVVSIALLIISTLQTIQSQKKENQKKLAIVPTITPIPTPTTIKEKLWPEKIQEYQALNEKIITMDPANRAKTHKYTFAIKEPWIVMTQQGVEQSRFVTIPLCLDNLFTISKKYCLQVDQPFVIGNSGWGYGNNKQYVETLLDYKNNVLDKTVFFYDDHVFISYYYEGSRKKSPIDSGLSSGLVSFVYVDPYLFNQYDKQIDSLMKNLQYN